MPHLTVGYLWIDQWKPTILYPSSGEKYTAKNVCQAECLFIPSNTMNLYKGQLAKPIPATDETHGLACTYSSLRRTGSKV